MYIFTWKLGKIIWTLHDTEGFPGGSDGKESACSVGALWLISGSERSAGEGNGNPPQCSCLENSMERGDRWATVYGVAKSETTEQLRLSLSFCTIQDGHAFYRRKQILMGLECFCHTADSQ